MGKDTLTITDNRTGKTYEVPIEDGTIKAMDLRQIKVGPDDFGLMTYDPAFMNTASCKSRITFIDGDKGILNYRGYPIERARGEEHLPRDRVPAPARRAADQGRSSTSGCDDVTHHTFVHENVKKLMDGFRYDAHPMGMLVVARWRRSPPSTRRRSSVRDPAVRRTQVYRLIAKMPTLAAFAYRHSMGMPYVYPDNDLVATPATSCR